MFKKSEKNDSSKHQSEDLQEFNYDDPIINDEDPLEKLEFDG